MVDDVLRVEEEHGKGGERRRTRGVREECNMGGEKDINEKREKKRGKRL